MINSSRLKLLLLPIALLVGMVISSHAATIPRRPNIVFILLDNLGQEWLGAYGSEEGCTPNIDRLAREGVRFENCYTPPVCGPSRIVLLTGRYPFRTGFTLHHDAALYSGGGLDPAREVVFARPLRDSGYATGIAGKWQINNLYDEPEVLTRHGFQEQLVWPGSLNTDVVRGTALDNFWTAVRNRSASNTVQVIRNIESRYWDPVFLRNGRREVQPGKFGPDVAQDFALDFIRRHRESPFLLYYPMVLTHGHTFTDPVIPTPLNLNTNRSHHELFADMVRYADRLIGQVVRELEQLGLRENTILFVATDNGTETNMVARWKGRQARGGLYTLTEAGGNVGLLVNSPKLVPGGRTAPLIDFTDIFPTLCELAGVTPPREVKLDGRSWAAFLRGEDSRLSRDWIFNQYGTRRVVRDGRYKLYSTGELFDAWADREEQHNLAKSMQPEIAAAREKLTGLLKSLPPDNPPPFELRSQSAFRLWEQRQK